ncbi:acid phosphatase [Cryptococcus gattii E566]|uniref:Acid phosphatase, putative n=1 Tax=Cryptococcus gattii serotype B (strain WM276 / ATCC MYA-4071) TaxID=367775 RepID=E6R241_CRYGW|nr:acid phosphatase, putative [Cryptococcus gattii WM276]ADV21280.1 acid phosphatase, putative [Cryptococcus gattii WM276]KIY36625.1 acid phosphatase [Cryptococcus gattii E566]
MRSVALFALLPILANAAAVERRTADSNVGSTTSDVFPPAGTSVNSKLFPPESVVGYPGATVTGVEPAAAATAAAYAYNDGTSNNYPLVADQPNNSSSGNFDVFKYWGNLSPWYSVPSSFYGLNDTSPLIPDGCSVTQVHLLYRHGARYPTSGAGPSTFAAKLAIATAQGGGFNATGDLSFLNTWTYKLGAELLTPFGRLQNFELGVAFRQQYGELLNNFTEQGALPVFRTESQDRMVKTAENFAAGFFGVPEYLDQVSIELMVETSGVNNTGAPYETCPNSNVASRGSLGSTAASAFAKQAFNGTVSRLQSNVNGVQFDATDIIDMLQLCSYETDALGYSAFCGLFTEEDFKNYEYYYDISFYYNNGAGSPVAAAQGKGFLQEFVSRFTQTPITSSNSSVNTTLDNNSTYFPLNQSIYADATHEVVLLDTLTAFNLTALFSTGALPVDKRVEGSSFVASQVVPFATHLVVQVLECANQTPTKQIRFIINDAVVPIDKSYEGCGSNKDGMCAFDTVVAALQKRIAEIDYDYDCHGDYTATVGNDYNGRAPRA